MKLNAYAVFDNKAQRFFHPFFVQTHPEAMRVFGENCQSKESSWNKYPEDFALFHVGTFDQATSQLASLETPALHLVNALDYVRKPALTSMTAAEINGLTAAGEAYLKS